MKAFIFENLEKVSNNYHEGGGLIVIARDEVHVRELIAKEEDIEVTNEEWERVFVCDLKNDEKPKIFVFPDAGCC